MHASILFPPLISLQATLPRKHGSLSETALQVEVRSIFRPPASVCHWCPRSRQNEATSSRKKFC
jgi:hypothetical protein